MFDDIGNASDHLAWLDKVQEEILEPELPIIDAHHHLWLREPPPYFLREFVHDLDTGHNVVATVYVEGHSMYRQDGPEEMRPVGESEFVSGMAAMSDAGQFGSTRVCRAMVGHADMMQGADVARVLDAHEIASGGRFRGVRVATGWHADASLHRPQSQQYYLTEKPVREALGVLQDRGLVLDSWLYHTQLAEVAEVANAFPGLSIVLNHTGVPIIGGPNRNRESEVFDEWRDGICELSRCPNVNLKLGALPVRKKDRENQELPPTSTDLQRAWGPWIETSIEFFGPDRCMFESNFPVHKNWCSYPVLWNGFKRITGGCSTEEKRAMYLETANRVYRVGANTDATN